MYRIRLEEIRREKEFTVRDLETATGVSTSVLMAIEHGRSDPRISTLVKISIALKVSLSELIEIER